MSVKVDFTCLICSKIYKNPFLLPCGDTICEEHLKEPEVLKNNSIKCKLCEEVFEVKNNEMIRPNKALQKLIQKELFLTASEKVEKKGLEKSLKKFSKLNEQLQESKNIFELDCYNHFQEIRRKIEVQREELKDQIDKLSFAMIDELKAIEESYSNRIREFKVEAYDLEKEKRILTETFRDVNLSMRSINRLENKQDEDVSRLRSNLSEISRMKTFMTESNDFKPNLPFHRDSFGLLSTQPSSTFIFDRSSDSFRMFQTSSPIFSLIFVRRHINSPWYNSSSQDDDSSSQNLSQAV
jgi:hypothetical protein